MAINVIADNIVGNDDFPFICSRSHYHLVAIRRPPTTINNITSTYYNSKTFATYLVELELLYQFLYFLVVGANLFGSNMKVSW